MSDTVRPVEITRVTAGGGVRASDFAATEEPLQIRVNGEPFAVVMRTPGHDFELTAGFLFAERVITAPEHLGTIQHCRDEAGGDAPNVVNVTVVGIDIAARMAERRQVMTASSCGLCGRLTIESLRVEASPITESWRVPRATIARLPEILRGAQDVFRQTGGLHAAALFDPYGILEGAAEDVGRHNAVDKVIGRRLLDDTFPIPRGILAVSGRTSFEIVQKAFLAGIPVLCAVSAPSSLAIELAQEAGITLIGFARGEGFNIYAHPARIEDVLTTQAHAEPV